MKKLFVLLTVLPMALACAQISGPVKEAGNKVAATAGAVATNSAAVLGAAVDLNLAGLIRAAGTGIANLIGGVADLLATPIGTAQDAVVDAVTPDAPAE